MSSGDISLCSNSESGLQEVASLESVSKQKKIIIPELLNRNSFTIRGEEYYPASFPVFRTILPDHVFFECFPHYQLLETNAEVPVTANGVNSPTENPADQPNSLFIVNVNDSNASSDSLNDLGYDDEQSVLSKSTNGEENFEPCSSSPIFDELMDCEGPLEEINFNGDDLCSEISDVNSEQGEEIKEQSNIVNNSFDPVSSVNRKYPKYRTQIFTNSRRKNLNSQPPRFRKNQCNKENIEAITDWRQKPEDWPILVRKRNESATNNGRIQQQTRSQDYQRVPQTCQPFTRCNTQNGNDENRNGICRGAIKKREGGEKQRKQRQFSGRE